jgi:hypothetical protein
MDCPILARLTGMVEQLLFSGSMKMTAQMQNPHRHISLDLRSGNGQFAHVVAPLMLPFCS